MKEEIVFAFVYNIQLQSWESLFVEIYPGVVHLIEQAKVCRKRKSSWLKFDWCTLVSIVVTPVFVNPLIADSENTIVFNIVIRNDNPLAESSPSSVGIIDLFPIQRANDWDNLVYFYQLTSIIDIISFHRRRLGAAKQSDVSNHGGYEC